MKIILQINPYNFNSYTTEKHMKALVVYLSRTGNTKKVAEAIFKEIGCEKDLFEISELTDLEGYDIIFAGFPVWQSGPAETAVKFLNKHSDGKNIAIFVTHALDYEMEKNEVQELLDSILNKCRACVPKGNFLGFFHCRGELEKSIAEYLLKSDNPQMQRFGKKRKDTIGHPDEAEIQVAQIFAKDVMNRINGAITV